MVRTVPTRFETREEDGALHISGYFAVFNSIYEIDEGMTESIAPGAFGEALGGDVRALTNHDSTLVLGRNTAGTLQLREDSHGLWGDILINAKDVDAMNLYERVKRSDVNQCSFGFRIGAESVDWKEDGSVHWTIERVDPLYEVSVCTFPAYESTSVSARSAERDELKARRLDAWKEKMKGVLSHGT
jgi:HK97 family phage prohead protease